MKGKFPKAIAVTLIAALAVGLTACAGSASPATGGAGTAEPTTEGGQAAEPASGGDGAIDLRMMWWGPEPRHEATLAVLELYKEVRPDITFTTEYMGWDGYWNKLVVLAASNTMPDVLQMDAQYIDNYVSKNQLADISAIDFGGIVDEAVLENIKIDGKLYTVPLGRNGAGISYNKTALDAAGVSLPQVGWTWDDLYDFIEEAAEKLPAGQYPMFDFTENWELYQFYQASNGGGRVIDGDTLNLDRELWFGMMERLAKYRAEGKVPTAEETVSFEENDAQLDSLASGKVMLRSSTVGSVGALASLMPDHEIGTVNWPLGPNGGGWAQSTIFLSVGAGSPYIEEAMEFERWFVTDTAAGELLMTVRGLPLSDEVYSLIEPKLEAADILGKDLYDVAAANKPMPFYPSSAQFIDFVARPAGIYKSTMELYMFGSITLEEAYDKLIAAGEELGATPVE